MISRFFSTIKRSMYINVLAVGDKIDMEQISDRFREEKATKYVSQVLHFGEDDTIHIAMPFEKGHLIPIDVKTRHNLCFYTKQGLYQCRCIVTDRYRSNDIYVVVIKLLTILEKYQRRQYYRLDCVMNIKYRVVSEEELNDMETYEKVDFSSEKKRMEFQNHLDTYDTNYESGVLCDISGGGVRLHSSKQMEVEGKIILSIPFLVDNEEQILKLMATVVFSDNIENKDGIFENRVEFIGISKKDREFIVKYVLDEEKKLRRNKAKF